MSTRMRALTTLVVSAIMLVSSVPFALAGPSAERVRSLRAESLAEKSLSAERGALAAASTETTIPVLGSSWYTDVAGARHFDGYFGTGSSMEMFKDVWVMIEFKNGAGQVLGMEEVMANEYVAEGEGTWSAKFATVPTGTTGAKATVYGTPTNLMGNMPVLSPAPMVHTLPGTDRHLEGTVTFGMVGMTSDPTLTDLIVSAVETHMGDFHDVALGGGLTTTPAPYKPGTAVAWRAWGARRADMATDIRFVHYSAVKYSTISAKASTKTPAYGTWVRLSGTVRNFAGAVVAGMPVIAVTSKGVVAGRGTTAADGTYAINVRPSVRTSYTLISLGDSYIASAESAAITIDPKVYLTRPSSPSVAYLNRAFTSTGYIKPRHTAGTYPVIIKAYRKISGKWVLKKTIKAKASNYSSYSKYTAKYSLPARGYWKLVSYHDNASHYLTKSSARYLTVR